MNDLFQSAKNVYDLGSALVVIISSMSVAFALRGLGMSERKIPITVILFAGTLSVLIHYDFPAPWRARLALNFIFFAIGMGLGLISIAFYQPIMKRIGDWIGQGDKDKDDKKEGDK
jgi:hypothetical protein